VRRKYKACIEAKWDLRPRRKDVEKMKDDGRKIGKSREVTRNGSMCLRDEHYIVMLMKQGDKVLARR